MPLTVDEFLQIDFGPDLNAERDNGVIRLMAGGTRAAQDRGVKLEECKAMPSVETIAPIDPDRERRRILQRMCDPAGWSDVDHSRPQDLDLPAFGVSVPHADVLARDRSIATAVVPGR